MLRSRVQDVASQLNFSDHPFQAQMLQQRDHVLNGSKITKSTSVCYFLKTDFVANNGKSVKHPVSI